MNANILDPSRGGFICILLSMDLTEPFLDSMGLDWLPQAPLRRLLRKWIQENRQRYLSDPSKVPDVMAFVLSKIDEEFGRTLSQSLQQWAVSVFCFVSKDQPDWSAWHVVLHRWLYNQRAREELHLSEPRRDELLTCFRKIVEADDIERLIEQQKKSPMSDWDLEIYALHQFNDEVGPDPYDAILATVEVFRVQAFWPHLLQLLSSDEQNVLWKNARGTLTRLGIGRGEKLVHPATMRQTEA